jgi:hypothetical protein
VGYSIKHSSGKWRLLRVSSSKHSMGRKNTRHSD